MVADGCGRAAGKEEAQAGAGLLLGTGYPPTCHRAPQLKA